MTFNGINKNQDVTRLPLPLASEKETWFWLWSVLVDLLYLFGREVSHKNLCSAPPCHEVACSPSSVVQTPAPGLVPGGSQVFVEREHQTSTYILFRETDANMLVVTVDESYLRMTKDDERE